MPPLASVRSDSPVTADDRAYFERRAEEEIERARESVDPRTVAIHYALSELYLERIDAARGEEEENAGANENEDEPIGAG